MSKEAAVVSSPLYVSATSSPSHSILLAVALAPA